MSDGKEPKYIRLYACKTDADYHIPDDFNGINLYFSRDSLRANRSCAESCGITSFLLDLSTAEVVQEPDLKKALADAKPLNELIRDEYEAEKKELARVINRLRRMRARKERHDG